MKTKEKNGIYIKSVKEQFVPCEFTLLDEYVEKLEKECRNSTLIYLLIQRYINRVPGHPLEGYSWVSRNTICQKLHIKPHTFAKAIRTLENHGLIIVDKLWKNQNVYLIPNLKVSQGTPIKVSQETLLKMPKIVANPPKSSPPPTTLDKQINKSQIKKSQIRPDHKTYYSDFIFNRPDCFVLEKWIQLFYNVNGKKTKKSDLYYVLNEFCYNFRYKCNNNFCEDTMENIWDKVRKYEPENVAGYIRTCFKNIIEEGV